jgi:F0F1-type ATP synthase membrane subunit b/b'
MEGLGINWKILLGDLITFAILFFLLRRFAFKPFHDILRKRKERIEVGLQDAEEAGKTLSGIRQLEKEVREMGEKKAKETFKLA